MDVPENIADFLAFLQPGSRFLLVAIHPNTGEITAESFVDYTQAETWALDWNGKGWNLYYTVNLTRRGLSKKASKADIQAARAFWADIDPDTKRSGDYLTARTYLLNGVLTELVAAKSTIVIDSGNGLQPLFLLNHPIALNGHMEAYEQLNAKVGAKFHGPGTFNCDRILRLPFTWNYPTKTKLAKGYPDTPSMARVIDCSGIRYGEEEIARLCRSRVEEFLESHPKAKARWGGSDEGLKDTTGSGFDFSMVAMLKAGGLSEEEVKEALYGWAHGSKDGRGSREWDRYFRRCWERTANIHDTQAATELGKETDAEIIARLAKMSAAEYESKRKAEAEKLGWRRSFLDEEVKRAREGARVDLSAAVPMGKGQGLTVHEADPWPYSIDLNEVLNELVTEINRYAVLSVHADTAIALWIAHTYVYDAGDISPFLFLTSPEKRCGKSTVLILLLGLVNRPMVASNISPSSIFRVIEACRPTLLIDEADTFFNENEELRGVMNSGHTKPLAYVIRTVDIGGGVFEPRQFSTWAPKAVAGIKRLADTLEDRSIIVELKRKLPGEHTERVSKFNGNTIRRKLTRWARDNFEAIKHADPQLPAGVYNRLADNWLPLLAIAELAGTEWADRATKALLAEMDNDSRTDSAGVMLLSDLKDLFNKKNNSESLATREILDRLHEMDDRPWPAWGKPNRPITSDALARLLKPFKVKPQQIKAHGRKGYRLADLLDAFDRYIPTKPPISPPSKSKPRNQQGTKPFSAETNPKPETYQVSTENQPKPARDKDGFEVSTRKGGDIGKRDVEEKPKGEQQTEITYFDDKQCKPRDEPEQVEAGYAHFPTPDYTLICSATDLERHLPKALASKIVAVDTETTGLDCHTHKLRLIQLGMTEQVLVIDLEKVPIDAIAPVFDGNRKLVFHNAKFDLKFLAKNGIHLHTGNGLFDTMLASQLLSAGLPEGELKGSSLAKVAERYLSIRLDKSMQGSDWFGDLFTDQLAYAARDAAVLLPLRETLRGQLLKDGLKAVAAIEFRCVPAIACMELVGVGIDAAAWISVGEEEHRRVIELEKRLDHAAGKQVNWGSHAQVLKVLKERGHEVISTKEEALRNLAVKDEFAALLLEHRESSKLVSTYGVDWVSKHVHDLTGRVHCDYVQIGCNTGRMSCTKPNMQNIPRGPRLRGLIRAPSGKQVIKADFSQIELRIAAVLSRDEAMLAAYKRGEDLHVATASRLLTIPSDEITVEQRQLAKAVNFGFIYGMGVPAFQTHAKRTFHVDLTEVEAARYRRSFFDIYPGIRKWHRSIKDGKRDTRTLTGRVRRDVNRFTDKLNSPDQGTGADGLKLALARLYEDRLGHGFPILAVHDELVIEAIDAGDVDWLIRHMKEAMSEVLENRCPVVVDSTIGDQWC